MPTFQVDKNKADNMKKIFLKKFSFETISLRTKGGLLHMTGISCARDECDIQSIGSQTLIPTYCKRAKK